MHTLVQPSAGADATTPRARVAIAGATGYAGQELVRWLSGHPGVTITAAMSSAASSPARQIPALRGLWDGAVVPLDHAALAAADIAFLALPDTAAAELAPGLVDAGVRVIDISGAFRLRDAAARKRWYPDTGAVPGPLAYGLTEHARAAVAGARMVANPGCYPTATLLALTPLVSAGLLASHADVIVDAKSGVSGAGKTPSERTHFCEVHGSLAAYGVFSHRHAAEIQQGVDVWATGHEVNFVPHLIPIDRGILATIYVRLAAGVTADQLDAAYAAAYGDAPFVRLSGHVLPEIKHVAHTNFCDIGWRVDGTRAVIVSVIDNLVKGAAGQAVQNMNVMLGLPETTGLR